ncbi:hypothetical protein C8T65DRAFT_57867 [Cerioporus squamosus]|nr:hypothetical protein C8T65DRAFT_57867 [Cerioporus squamosus]
MAASSSSPRLTECVYNAPMPQDMLGNTIGLDTNGALARNLKHLAESRLFTLGPMPVQDFLDEFLPRRSDEGRGSMLSSEDAFSTVPTRGDSSADIYRPLIVALNKRSIKQSRCPGFVFEDVASRSVHPRRLGHMKPHICCFVTEHAGEALGADNTSRAELGFTELFLQVNPDPAHDFYHDPPATANPVVRAAHHFGQDYDPEDDVPVHVLESGKALGQHIAYVQEVFARQFRIFFFTVSLAGSRARLLRWDRSGCVVSESFDIRERPDLLCEFLWRFSQASVISRGHDTTVEDALPEHEDLFRRLVEEETGLQLGFVGEQLERAIAQHYEPGKVMIVHVPAEGETLRDRQYLISRPVMSAFSVAGRGTRGYWAVDVSRRAVVFMKDTWRSRSSDELEGDTLCHLNAAGVRNVPFLVAHGDVLCATHESCRTEYQTTKTDEYASQAWVCRVGDKSARITRRRHYRLVLGPVGYDLRFFEGADELLHATYDAFIAMVDALRKDSRIHRDISAGNVILARERGSEPNSRRKGCLIDWESSTHVDDAGLALKAGRAGTWEFMSIKMLSDIHGTARQTIEDDMESLLYVVLYCALLWLPHNLSVRELSETYTRFFEFSTIHGGAAVGGDAKASNAYNRRYTRDIVFDCPAVKTWLDTIMDYCSPRRGAEKGKWTPDHVDAFWSDFLATQELDRRGRVAHRLERNQPRETVSSADDDSEETSTEARESTSGSVEHPNTSVQPRDPFPVHEHSPSPICPNPEPKARQPADAGLAAKRTTRAAAAAENAPRPKRTRVTQPAQGTTPEPPSSSTLRRSQRIQDQQTRGKAEEPKTASRSSGRKARTPASGTRVGQSSRTARGRGRGRGRGAASRK